MRLSRGLETLQPRVLDPLHFNRQTQDMQMSQHLVNIVDRFFMDDVFDRSRTEAARASPSHYRPRRARAGSLHEVQNLPTLHRRIQQAAISATSDLRLFPVSATAGGPQSILARSDMPTPGPNNSPSSGEAPLSHPLTPSHNPIFSNTALSNSKRSAATDGSPSHSSFGESLPGNPHSPRSFSYFNNHSLASHGVARPHSLSQSFFPSASNPMASPIPNLNFAQTHTTQQPQFQPQFSSQGSHSINRDLVGATGFQSATLIPPSAPNQHWSAPSSHFQVPGGALGLDSLAGPGSYSSGIQTTFQSVDQAANWGNGPYVDEVMMGTGEAAGGWSSTQDSTHAQSDFYSDLG